MAGPGPGQVAVDITYTGICGTDVHGYTDGYMLPPAVFGHEWTGSISAVGDGVAGLQVGQRVVGGGLSDVEAALVESTTVAFHAVRRVAAGRRLRGALREQTFDSSVKRVQWLLIIQSIRCRCSYAAPSCLPARRGLAFGRSCRRPAVRRNEGLTT